MSLLITPLDFAGYVDISQYIATKRLEPHILPAQLTVIRPILGEDLFNDLCLMVSNSQETPLTDTYKKLLTAIVPVLVYASAQDYLIWAPVNFTAHGVVQKKSEFSTPLDKDQIALLVKNLSSKLSLFESELRKFIEKNKADYPLYPQESCAQQAAQKGGRSTIIAIRN